MKIITFKKIGLSTLLVASLLVFTAGSAEAFTQLSGTLGLGATGANVTSLQTFLASNSSIYPQGLITGLFGPLTQQAVRNFQGAFGISQVGSVGPITLAKINSLISSGVNLTGISGGGVGADVNAPIIYTPSVSTSRTGAVISWATSEPATAEVYYSPTPFQLTEAIGSGEPSIIGGSNTGDSTTLQASSTVGLQNLQPSTIYYYMVESTDASGNLQYTWPSSFMTTN
jgi:peptidoglycan hydrolase-like protein with peptidoglycan-binding domain